MTRLRHLSLILLTLVLLLSVGARAAELEFDAQIGDDFDRSISAQDVHRFLVPAVSGTVLRAKLEAEAADEDDAGKDASGPAPTLVILSPSDALLRSATGLKSDIRVTATESDEYIVEVRAQAYAGRYELQLRGSHPDDDEGTEGTTTEGPVGISVGAPLGSSVRIEVKRVSGGRPRVVSVLDGTGREMGFRVKQSRKQRVRLHPIPVTAEGGLTVVVESVEPGGGTYAVTADPKDDDEEEPEDDDDIDERRIVVHLAAGTDVNALADQLDEQFDWDLIDIRNGFAVFETPDGREGLESQDARSAEAAFPEILTAEPDLRAQTPEGTQSNGVALGSSLGRSSFDNQPALSVVRAGRVRGRANGSSVVVAVLDTGIDRTHPLFETRVLPGWDFVDDDSVPDEVLDGVDNDLDGETDEGYGHGTFVAGLVLAAAPGVEILPVRVLDTEGRGTSSDIAAGLQYAIDQGVDVINLSLGTRARSRVLQGAVRLALSHGIVVVASTGNGGSGTRIDFPAGLAGVLAVSALDNDKRRAPFANGSKRTSVSAPGVELIGPYPNGQWAQWSGTSFATALVSGGVALLRERHPTWPGERITRVTRRRASGLGQGLSPAERRRLGGVLHLGRLAR